MNDAVDCKTIKINSIKLIKGNYEGYDYYKLVATTDNKIKLQAKLTAFEYDALLAKERAVK